MCDALASAAVGCQNISSAGNSHQRRKKEGDNLLFKSSLHDAKKISIRDSSVIQSTCI